MFQSSLMFGKLSTLFNNNEDQFTRTQNQFIEQWRCVVETLSTQSAMQATDVYDTKAAVHIADMINMIEHDRIPDDSDYGPCVEFILQNEVLATLQLYAQNDVPTGMRRIVLTLFSQLVQKLQRSVLPHLNVHKPLQDMICVCGGGKYPIDEINFITSILGKFHEDPSLVNLFMNETTRAKNGVVNYELRLVDALISLSHSKEDPVVKKSCEGLLLCVAADSEYFIDSILSYTILVQDLVSRLCERYSSFQADPETLLTTHNISWNSHPDHVLQEGTGGATLPLLLWLDYINTLTSSSHPNFTKKFLRHLSKVFLHTHILNDLNSGEPLEVVKALAMCQKMLSVATSELLCVEVLKFLTDDPVIATLCSLLNHEDTRVLSSALVLLNELFEMRHSLVVETLVLRYTRRNVGVRSRILLEMEENRPVLQRANSSDSGVEEMYSDEETSFIHMNTSLFEPDQPSPLLARKLKELSMTLSQNDVMSSQNDVTSSQNDVTSSHNYLVLLEDHVTSSDSDSNKPSSTESNSISLSELMSNSSTSLNEQNDEQNNSEKSENSVAPDNDEQEQNVSENEERKQPKNTPLNCSSITLDHNRVGSPHQFKTVIVSHDQAEDARKVDKNGKISLKLDISVAKILDVMPVLYQPRMIGFSEYLYDAHIKESEVQVAYSWIPPHYSNTPEEELSSEMGVFLEKVVSMVLNIPYQSYMINMLLMSLISEIVHIPHESVTILFLDTTLPTTPLYTALLEVSQIFTDIFEASPTLKEQLLTVPDSEMPDVCRAASLTEEFCKELAAVTLIKSTS